MYLMSELGLVRFWDYGMDLIMMKNRKRYYYNSSTASEMYTIKSFMC